MNVSLSVDSILSFSLIKKAQQANNIQLNWTIYD